MDNNAELQDSSQPDGEQNTDDQSQEIDYKAKFEEIDQKNKDLYARFKKFESEHKGKGKKKDKGKSKKEGKPDYSLEIDKVKLKVSNPTLTDDQVDKAFAYSQVEGTSPQEVVNSAYFKAYVSSQQKSEADSKSTPTPSNRANPSDRSDFANMSEEKLTEFVKNSNAEQFKKYDAWRRGSEHGRVGSGMRLLKKRNF